MSNPNESPLNVRKLIDTKQIYEAVKELHDYLINLEEQGQIVGSITHFGETEPAEILGDNGDIYLREIGQDWQVWSKRNNVWELIAKKGETI